MDQTKSFAVFCGNQRIASGRLPEMLATVKEWAAIHGEDGILYFEDWSGRQTDFNLREPTPPPPGPGRPKLGVVSREISLLPRHWEWLQDQPNGASAAIRRLIDQARHSPALQERQARESAGRFLSAVAGNFPGYEEVTRALYAGDSQKMVSLMSAWPADVRSYASRLLGL